MNRARATLLTVLMTLSFGCASSKSSDQSTQITGSTVAVNAVLSDRDILFMNEEAEARLMYYQEGQMAARRGHRRQVRAYGRMMMQDQTQLLQELRAMAKKESISLPQTFSEKRNVGLQELKQTPGQDFDKKYIEIMTIETQRDIDEFNTVRDQVNGFHPSLQKFADKNLPLLNQHLKKIQDMK